MAEYWKSQPKKFCEFCKVWITDNKPSIEFHERGKKHQENTKRRISEVQKKGRDTQKANEQRKKDLEAIEAAALKAYQKDLEELSKPSSETGKLSKENDAHSDDKTPSGSTCVIIYHGTVPVAHCTHGWAVGKSPEGHYYYYNASTNSSQWQIPQCMARTVGENSPESSTSTTDKERTKAKKPESKGQENKERSTIDKEAKSNDSTIESTTSSHYGPYGEWTTVVSLSSPSERTFEDQLPELKEAESKPLDGQNAENTSSEGTKQAKPLFKERVAPKLNIGKGESEEVAFKKRKLNSKKKQNIRRTEFAT